MNPNKELTVKEKLVSGIENFFKTKSALLWVIVIILVGLLIFFFIWNTYSNKSIDDSTKLVEDIQEKFYKWIDETDQTKKNELDVEIIDQLSSIVKKYRNNYAAQRALFLRAKYYTQKKEWEKAAKDYSEIAHNFKNSILAEESLLNAASCYEEIPDYNTAINLHKEFQTLFTDSKKFAYSLFSTGRIFEQIGNINEAGKIYEKLESDYLSSDWTKLAQNRLIILKTKNGYKKE